MFVSIGLRVRIEAEALNMVESLGAQMRHRTASAVRKVVKEGQVRYRVVPVPAISGQSLANGYQRLLVDMALSADTAQQKKLQVCEQCKDYKKLGGFIKYGNLEEEDDVKEKLRTNKPEEVHDKLVRDCIVEDIAGFLVPGANARRTSAVAFSFMLPDVDGGMPAIDPQFHVRYNFVTNDHRPFTVETGSGVYMLMVGVDVGKIGALSSGQYVEGRAERVELAFDALLALFEGPNFGAKRSRHTPFFELLSGVGAVSKPVPFSASPPRVRAGDNFIDDTIKRACKAAAALKPYGECIHVYYFNKEGFKISEGCKETSSGGCTVTVEEVGDFADLMGKIKKCVFEKLEQGP